MPYVKPDPRRAEAYALRQQGTPSKQIATQFGISENTLAGWLYRERNAQARLAMHGARGQASSLDLAPTLNGSGAALQPVNTQGVSQSNMSAVSTVALDKDYRQALKVRGRRLNGKEVTDAQYKSAVDTISHYEKVTKGRQREGEPEDQRTAYRGMSDRELAERTVSAACELVGLEGVKGILRKLEETGQVA